MRTLIMFFALASLAGCSRMALDNHLNDAYRNYDQGNCEEALLDLSRAERTSRARRYVQPEISLLRGQCLERQALFVDAMQIYQFIVTNYPASEYAYRARARMDTLRQLGHDGVDVAVKVNPVKP